MDKPTNGNGQYLRLPLLVLVSAFILVLLGLTRWTYSTTASLEQRKADRSELSELAKKINREFAWNRCFHTSKNTDACNVLLRE